MKINHREVAEIVSDVADKNKNPNSAGVVRAPPPSFCSYSADQAQNFLNIHQIHSRMVGVCQSYFQMTGFSDPLKWLQYRLKVSNWTFDNKNRPQTLSTKSATTTTTLFLIPCWNLLKFVAIISSLENSKIKSFKKKKKTLNRLICTFTVTQSQQYLHHYRLLRSIQQSHSWNLSDCWLPEIP